jgi:hypothetical protein
MPYFLLAGFFWGAAVALGGTACPSGTAGDADAIVLFAPSGSEPADETLPDSDEAEFVELLSLSALTMILDEFASGMEALADGESGPPFKPSSAWGEALPTTMVPDLLKLGPDESEQSRPYPCGPSEIKASDSAEVNVPLITESLE